MSPRNDHTAAMPPVRRGDDEDTVISSRPSRPPYEGALVASMARIIAKLENVEDKIDALEARAVERANEHEEHDKERFAGVVDRIADLERIDKEAVSLELVSQRDRADRLQRERQESQRAQAATRAEWIARVVLLVIGAVLSLAGGALAHATGVLK